MKTLILIGMKACGKSTIGKILAKKLNMPFIELDFEIEQMHKNEKKEDLSCRQIINKYQQDYFRKMENLALKKISLTRINQPYVLACGGGTPVNPQNRMILKRLGKIIYLKTDKAIILKRIKKDGIPAFFPKNTSLEDSLNIILEQRSGIYDKLADLVIDIHHNNLAKIINNILTVL